MMFLDCPACLDQDGTVRCGLPTAVRYQFPMRSSDVVTVSLTALDLGETACIPRLGDPAAIEDYHASACQLVQASGTALTSRYLTTAVSHTQAEPPARRPRDHSRPSTSPPSAG